jgi:predicted DNA-binding transcriptional regulator YafY
MMNLFLTQETFQPYHEVPNEAALSNRGWQDQVSDVVFRVGPKMLAEAMDHFHQADKQFHDDGGMTMRIPVYQPLEARWLWSFLLSLGSGVEVLEPLELRGILKEQLQNALQLYEEV